MLLDRSPLFFSSFYSLCLSPAYSSSCPPTVCTFFLRPLLPLLFLFFFFFFFVSVLCCYSHAPPLFSSLTFLSSSRPDDALGPRGTRIPTDRCPQEQGKAVRDRCAVPLAPCTCHRPSLLVLGPPPAFPLFYKYLMEPIRSSTRAPPGPPAV